MGPLKRTAALVAASAAVLAPGGATMATADTGPSDVVSVIGQGWVDPGLPVTGCSVNPHILFNGPVTFTPNSDDAKLSGGMVNFVGTGGTCATLSSDNGTGTLTGVLSGNVTFTRTQNEVQVAGTATVNGEAHTITANCQFVPTDVNPTMLFELACQALLDS